MASPDSTSPTGTRPSEGQTEGGRDGKSRPATPAPYVDPQQALIDASRNARRAYEQGELQRDAAGDDGAWE